MTGLTTGLKLKKPITFQKYHNNVGLFSYLCFMKYNMSNVVMLRSLTGNTISLNEYIKAYYDCEILEFPKDKLELIRTIVDTSIEVYRENPYDGRVNEMGNYMEECLHRAILRLGIGESNKLGVGYPDNCSILRDLNYKLYMDPKVSKDVNNTNGFRMFYTSTPTELTKKRKNISDGYHLLVNYEHDGNNNLTGKYKITDLDGFIYYMVNKQEASSSDIYNSHRKVILESL